LFFLKSPIAVLHFHILPAQVLFSPDTVKLAGMAKQLSRAELYALVWSEPMKTLSVKMPKPQIARNLKPSELQTLTTILRRSEGELPFALGVISWGRYNVVLDGYVHGFG
jgi:hypothetical protein